MMFLGVLIAVAAMAFTLLPLLRRDEELMPQPVGDEERRHLEGRRKAIYESIRDVDFDLEMGKLTAEDHREQHAELMADARTVVEDLDRAAKGVVTEDWIERQIAWRRRPESTTAAACSDCGRDNPAGSRFCDGCGQAIAGATCGGCGESLRTDARFCGACGAAR